MRLLLITSALALSLVVGPTLARPATHLPPHARTHMGPSAKAQSQPTSGGSAAAELSYIHVVEANSAALQACLDKFKTQVNQINGDTILMAGLGGGMAEMKTLAQQGKQLSCPARYQPVQSLYSAAMDEVISCADELPDAVSRQDAGAVTRDTQHLEKAQSLVQSAQKTLDAITASPRTVASPNRTGAETALARKVEDYNDLLRRAQDASRNADAATRLEKGDADLSVQQAGTPEGKASDRRVTADLANVNAYEGQAYDALLQALRLRRSIRADRKFARDYHETDVCLTYDRIPTKLFGSGASTLRFIERRGMQAKPADASSPTGQTGVAASVPPQATQTPLEQFDQVVKKYDRSLRVAQGLFVAIDKESQLWESNHAAELLAIDGMQRMLDDSALTGGEYDKNIYGSLEAAARRYHDGNTRLTANMDAEFAQAAAILKADVSLFQVIRSSPLFAPTYFVGIQAVPPGEDETKGWIANGLSGTGAEGLQYVESATPGLGRDPQDWQHPLR